jgi:hypothetical protein
VAEWDDIFDVNATRIRCAFSAKVKHGKLEATGVYALPGVDPDALTPAKKVRILAEYSIYALARASWIEGALEAFEEAEKQLLAAKEGKAKYNIVSEYATGQKSIEFLGEKHLVSGALLNDFIHLVPHLWTDKHHWGIMLGHVKCAATLVNDFNSDFFLHKWRAENTALYNKEGNNDQYARCQIKPEAAGESLTWLRNMARAGWQSDPNLGRGDMGWAEIFAGKRGQFIKIVSDDGTCYLWDDTNRLWIHCNNKWIGNEVSNVLEKEFKAEMKKFNGMNVIIDVTKKLKTIDKDMKRVLSYHGAMDVVNKVSPLLEDMDFMARMNIQPDMMPIRDGLIVDLRTGLTAQRNPEHNFTFECPVRVDRDPAKRELIEKFMLDICCGDQDLLAYMQVALGYSITGQVSEKAVFV